MWTISREIKLLRKIQNLTHVTEFYSDENQYPFLL